MRILLQRVSRASVSIDGQVAGRVDRGLLLLAGVHRDDTPHCAEFLAAKCADLRIFPSDDGKMGLSCKEIGGGALVVSQFTLYGECRKGRRPDFTSAASSEKANGLYTHFVESLRTHLPQVQTGVFGAMMSIELVNDGPVTLILEKCA